MATFSRSICLEYRSHGIDIQCQVCELPVRPVIAAAVSGITDTYRTSKYIYMSAFPVQAPLFVSTKMTKLGTNVLVPSAEMYGRSSVRWMGYDALCCPFWFHSVQSYITRSLPDSLVSWCIFQYFLGMHRAARGKSTVTS